MIPPMDGLWVATWFTAEFRSQEHTILAAGCYRCVIAAVTRYADGERWFYDLHEPSDGGTATCRYSDNTGNDYGHVVIEKADETIGVTVHNHATWLTEAAARALRGWPRLGVEV